MAGKKKSNKDASSERDHEFVNDVSSFDLWVDQILKCAYKPTHIRYFPYNVNQLAPVESLQVFRGLLSHPEKKQRILYSKECIFTSNIHGIHLATFLLLNRFKTTILTSATISEYQYQLIDSITKSNFQKALISSTEDQIFPSSFGRI